MSRASGPAGFGAWSGRGGSPADREDLDPFVGAPLRLCLQRASGLQGIEFARPGLPGREAVGVLIGRSEGLAPACHRSSLLIGTCAATTTWVETKSRNGGSAGVLVEAVESKGRRIADAVAPAHLSGMRLLPRRDMSELTRVGCAVRFEAQS